MKPMTLAYPMISRYGRVGSIQRFPLWDGRLSPQYAKEKIADISALSYGREEAKNPEGLFNRIRREQHLSCFEFVPFLSCLPSLNCLALPGSSIRHHLEAFEYSEAWGVDIANYGNAEEPGAIFLVEAPLFVARQWMRHRNFSYLEVSRRYTPVTRMGLKFYGEDDPTIAKRRAPFWDFVRDEFDARLAAGEPLELARGCFPVETMTKFFVGGFTKHWLEAPPKGEERIPGFTGLRSEAHAQAEIQVFSNWILDSLTEQKGDMPYLPEGYNAIPG